MTLPGSINNFNVPFSCGSVDLSGIRSSKTCLAQLPLQNQRDGSNTHCAVHELLLQDWPADSLFRLCQSVASILEVILQKKADELIIRDSDILSCRHLVVPFNKRRSKRLDANLRESLANVKPEEYSHIQKRLRPRGSPAACWPGFASLRGVTRRSDAKLVRKYIQYIQTKWKELAPHERSIWIAADAATVGMEGNVCCSATLGYNGHACWLTPQAKSAKLHRNFWPSLTHSTIHFILGSYVHLGV